MDKKIWLPQHRGGMTRRGFLRRVGMGATALALSNGGFLMRRPTRALAASMLPGGYLSTSGSQIIGSNGQAQRLVGVNWYGCDCFSNVVGGLDYQTIDQIAGWIASNGFNVVRIPFSVQFVVNMDSFTLSNYVSADPSVQGQTTAYALTEVINTLGAHGVRVILDCHRTEAGWSTQENGLWYTDSWSEQDYLNAWTTMVQRFGGLTAPGGSPIVIGCDLRNEPGSQSPAMYHTGLLPANANLPFPENVTTNSGSLWGNVPDQYGRSQNPSYPSDWRAAAERAGNTVLGVNPNLLIFVEGVRYDPSGPSSNGDTYWFGGNLTGVGARGGVNLPSNKLVYSIHDYGPDAASVPWCQPDGSGSPYAGSADNSSMCFQTWDNTWGYLVANNIAPVWIGEFGTPNGYRGWYVGDPMVPTDPNPQSYYTQPQYDPTTGSVTNPQGAWFSYLIQYIQQRGIHWSYWALNGTQSQAPTRDPDAADWYGILRPDWQAWASQPMQSALQPIM